MDSTRKVGELKTPSGEGLHPQGCVTTPARGEEFIACVKQAEKHAKEFFELKLEELVPNSKQVRRKHQWPAARLKVGKLGKRDRRKGETLKSTSEIDDSGGPPKDDETKTDDNTDDDLPGLVDVSKPSDPDEGSFLSGIKKGFLNSATAPAVVSAPEKPSPAEKLASAVKDSSVSARKERRDRWDAELVQKMEHAREKISGSRFHPVDGDLDSREMEHAREKVSGSRFHPVDGDLESREMEHAREKTRGTRFHPVSGDLDPREARDPSEDGTDNFASLLSFMRGCFTDAAWSLKKVDMQSVVSMLCKVLIFLRASKKFSEEHRTLASYCELLTGMFSDELFRLFGNLVPDILSDGGEEIVSSSFVTDLLETGSHLLQNPHVKRLLRVLGIVVGAAVARAAKLKVDSTRLSDLWDSFIGGSKGMDAVTMLLDFTQWLFALFFGEGSRWQTLFCGYDTRMMRNMSRAAELLSSSGHPRLNADGVRSLNKVRSEIDSLATYFIGELNAGRNKAFAGMYHKNLVEYSEKLRVLITSTKPKEQPYCLFFSGPAGQGKSALCNLIIRAIEGHCNFLGTRGLSPEEIEEILAQETYVHNCSATKWLSGYQSQKVMIFEDMCNSKNTGQGDSSPLNFLIGAVNNNTAFTDQADVDSKGCVPYAAEVVLVSSNTRDLMVNQLTNSPFSVARRLHLRIVPTLIGEPNGAVDPANWRIEVFRPVRNPLGEGVTRPTDGFTWELVEVFDYAGFMRFILKDYDAHVEQQRRFMESVSQNSKYCPRGQLTSVCPNVCRCEDSAALASTSLTLGQIASKVRDPCSAVLRRTHMAWTKVRDPCSTALSNLLMGCMAFHPWCVYAFQYLFFLFAVIGISGTAWFYYGCTESLVGRVKKRWLMARQYLEFVTYCTHRRLYHRIVPNPGKVMRKGCLAVGLIGMVLVAWRTLRGAKKSTAYWSKTNPGSVHHGASVHGADTTNTLSKVDQNRRKAEIRSEDRTERFEGLMIQSFAMLVPKHAVSVGQCLNVIREQQGVDVEAQVVLDDVSLRPLDGDLVLIISRNLGTAKSLVNYFPENFVVGDRLAFLFAGGVRREIRLVKSQRVVTDKANFIGTMYRTLDGSSVDVGTSGSVVLDYERNAPMGISLASNQGTVGFFQVVTKNLMSQCTQMLRDTLRSDYDLCTELPTSVEDVVISTKGIHPKSHPRFMEKCCHVPIANCERRTKAKSNIRPSEIAHMFVDNPTLTTFGPAALAGNWTDYTKTRNKMVEGVSTFPLGLLLEASKIRSAEIREQCKVIYPPLTLNQIVCGIDGEGHIDHMEQNSSAGCPHFGPKSQFLRFETDSNGEQVFIGLTDVQQQSFDEMIACLERGFPVPCLFVATKKDEALRIGKVPRTFYAASMNVIMAVRKYFCPVLQALKANPIHAEIAIGTNAFGKDWADIYSHLASYSTETVIAGDYSSFDMSHNADAVRCAMQVLLDLIDESSLYSDVDKLAARTLVESLGQSFMAFDGTWMQVIGWVMSGVPLTAELSSILNQIYMRVVWKVVTQRPISDFRSHVALIVYGDDNNAAVRDEPTYNFQSVAVTMGGFRMTYTNTDKNDEMHIYQRLEDAEFLKRLWIPGPLKVYAPLSWDSINKRIVWTRSRAPDRVRSLVYSVAADCLEHQFEGLEYWKKFCHTLCQEEEVDGQVPYKHLVEGDPIDQLFSKIGPSQLSADPFWETPLEDDAWTVFARGKLSTCISTSKVARPEVARGRCESPRKFQDGGVVQLRFSGIYQRTRSGDRLSTCTPHLDEKLLTETLCNTLKFYDTSGLRENSHQTMSNGTEHRPGEVDGDLASILSRPTRVFTDTWKPGTNFYQASNIWKSFLNDDTIVDKISHFARLRGKMVVRLLINGNSMYYGKLVMHYSPFAQVDDVYTVSSVPDPAEWIQIMQKPHVSFDATTTTGATMELPMLLPNDWIDLTDDDMIARLGTLYIHDLNTLEHANAGTDELTVTLVAWMEDVELYLPTSTSEIVEHCKGEHKGGDEYETAKTSPLSISGTLTTVANVAAAASSLPHIGAFSKATEIVARAGASAAKLFGYSRPPLLGAPEPFVPRYLSSLANCDVPETVQKFSMTGRQEVCVDSSPLGIDTGDELQLAKLVGKEGYLTTFTWDPSNLVDGKLMDFGVNPMYHCPSTTNTGAYALTPLAYFSQPFRYWRGSIKYRFEVVASAFHRGRLRVVWDPVLYSLNAPFNQNFSVVLDIAEQRDFTVVVPYGAAQPYLENTRVPEDGVIYGSLYSSVDEAQDNGNLAIMVLNELSTIKNSADNVVYVNVYVSAGDDFRVAMPCAEKIMENRFVSTSEIVSESGADPTLVLSDAPMTEGNVDSRVDEVVFGETVVSFRTLLKRYNLSYGFSPTIVAGTNSLNRYTVSSFPPYRGAVDGARDTYNYACHTLLNHLAPCFLGYRGGIRHKFVHMSPSRSGLLAASLGNSGPSGITYNHDVYDMGNGVTFVYNASEGVQDNPWRGLSGTALTPSTNQPVLEVEVPHYTSRKYIHTRSFGTETLVANTAKNVSSRAPSVNISMFSPPATGHFPVLDFVSIGEDFNLLYFICTPLIYRGASPAPA